MYIYCDQNPQIRYESIELFRLAFIISINRETSSSGGLGGQNSATSNCLNLSSTQSSLKSSNSNLDNQNQAATSGGSSAIGSDENLEKCKLCFKNSVKQLESLISEYSTSSKSNSNQSSSTSSSSNRDDKIHGYLLIILEIIRFSFLDFEKQIEKYLSTYNLYHQQIQKGNNNIFFNLNIGNSGAQGPNVVRKCPWNIPNDL
jgi:hypothetical protein